MPVDERGQGAAAATGVPPERDGRIFAPPTPAPTFVPAGDSSFAGRPMANWGYRVGAFMVDVSWIVLIGLGVGSLSDALGASADSASTITGLAILGLWLIDSVVIVALTNGQSVGKRLAGTRIVRENGQRVGFGTGLLRDTVCRVVLFIPLVALVDTLMPLGDKRQSLRDKMVSTRVVQEPVYRARRWLLTGAALALTGAWIALTVVNGSWDTSDTYEAYDRDAFISGCSAEDTSEADCGCAFDQIKAKLSYDEYRAANSTDDTDQWAPRTRRVIADAFTSCTD